MSTPDPSLVSAAVVAYLGWPAAKHPLSDSHVVVELADRHGVLAPDLTREVARALAIANSISVGELTADAGPRFKDALRAKLPEVADDAIDALTSHAFWQAHWGGSAPLVDAPPEPGPSPDVPDLTNLPSFIKHLSEVDPLSASFARVLLRSGAAVETFWGPEQMDVWELRCGRGQMVVRFGIERGYSDGVLISLADTPAGRNGVHPLRLAVISWARANGIALQIDDPDQPINLAEHGLPALDWVASGHFADVERVEQAWRGYREKLSRLRSRTRGNPDPSELEALKAAGVAAIEAAARLPVDGAQYWRRSLGSGARYFKLVDGQDFLLNGDRWEPYDRYRSGPSWWRLTGEIGADVIDASELPAGAPH